MRNPSTIAGVWPLFLRLVCLCLICCICSSALPAQHPVEQFSDYLTGEWNNFQQCWLENTETESHRISTAYPHRHVHALFERDTAAGPWAWRVIYYSGDRHQLLGRYALRLTEFSDKYFKTDVYAAWPDSISAVAEPVSAVLWRFEEGVFRGRAASAEWILKKDTLLLLDEALFQHASREPYCLLKCRFFRGWIQYPMEHIRKDSVYFYGGLILHDQGGTASLRFPDGTFGEYTVELTQLVHNRRTPILKLAVYQEPADRLHWNSRAIAYTWADPSAWRIGINIRKVASGWTLIKDK